MPSFNLSTFLFPQNNTGYAEEYLNETGCNITSKAASPYQRIEDILYTHIITVICLFGIIGNAMNLFVLTRNSLTKTMHTLEKNSHIGLIALSASDFLFCLVVLPQAVSFENRFIYESADFWLIYHVYRHPVINIFVMCSTWLTVTMATQRFLAICYPMRSRATLTLNFSRFCIVGVVVFSVAFNLPRFWYEKIWEYNLNGKSVYFIGSGYMRDNNTLDTVYLWIYFIIAIIIPLILLSYCNINLIRSLKNSATLRREHSNEKYTSPRATETTNRITLTLIVIVLMYLVLVVPAEIVNFLRDIYVHYDYNLIGSCANIAQTVNFSFNFILYCVVNSSFRKALREIAVCRPCRRGYRLEESSGSAIGLVRRRSTDTRLV